MANRISRIHPPRAADSPNRLVDQALSTREKISRKRSIAELESSNRTSGLRRSRRKTARVRADRSHKGWSAERRARQAASVRNWAPWQRSTGPKTASGKARCAMNALKHGFFSRARIREYQRVRNVLRLAALNIERVRLFIRARDARARIKYKFPPCAPAPRTRIRNLGVSSFCNGGLGLETKMIAARVRNTGFPSPLWERDTA